MLGSYPGLKLMTLLCKSFMLVKICVVDDQSDIRRVITWISKMIVQLTLNLSLLTYYQTHPHPHPHTLTLSLSFSLSPRHASVITAAKKT
jgi:hypothetical protein